MSYLCVVYMAETKSASHVFAKLCHKPDMPYIFDIFKYILLVMSAHNRCCSPKVTLF